MLSLGALRLKLEIAIWRHGWLWLASTGFALTSLLVWGWFVPQQRTDLHEVQAQIWRTDRRASLSHPVEASSAGEYGTAQDLLDAALRKAPAPAIQFESILQAGRKYKVDIASANFSEHRDEATGLIQTEVEMPLRSTYPQVRLLLNEVLRSAPNISLDRIEFTRGTVSQGTVDSKVHLSLWRVGTLVRKDMTTLKVRP